MGYAEIGDGPPTLLIDLYGNDLSTVQGPLCGTMNAADVATVVDPGADRDVLQWVGGPNYVGQWTQSLSDPEDLTAALYMWD